MPRYLGPILLGVAFSLLAVSTIFVALRFYCRQFIVRRIGADDWIILVALSTVWGIGVLNWYQVDTGTGTHAADLPKFDPTRMSEALAQFVVTLKVWYIYQLMYPISLFFVKLSVLAFYHRLSPNKTYQRAIWITGGIVTLYTIVMVLLNAFECKKPSDAWNPVTWPKGCRDLIPIYYGQAGFNIGSDIVILMLPIPTLLKLQVNKTKRVMLLLVFSVGGIAVIASIVRINALYIFQHSKDKPYDGAHILIWSQVELNAAIISSSAPALKPLLKGLIGGSSVFRSKYGNKNGYKAQSKGVELRSFNGQGSKSVSGDTVVHTTEIRGKRLVNESEGNIVVSGGIYRTTNVIVDVEHGNGGRKGTMHS
ncbi:hypothetical protein BGX38DRAFT_1274844 [Terfezia claveryi]|nr:hypothetical protein BGX38DRAFT_1274844 [Terfezia claveryi]